MTSTIIPTWTLGDRLAKARRDVAKLTTRQMAEVLGVHKNTVTNWETGAIQPRRYAITAWAQVTGVSEAWLLGDQNGDDAGPEGAGVVSVCAPWDSNPEPADYASVQVAA
jgi:transcriptional regulator with XRE-family HTH domain